MIRSATTNRAEDVMKVRIGDRIYEVPDSCPLDAPTTRVIKNHLKTHGLESLLTSQKLSPFAGCVDGLADQPGVEIVMEVESPETSGEELVSTQPVETKLEEPRSPNHG